MPCFHFTVNQEEPSTTDGLELPDLHAARLEAVQLAGAMLADTPEDFWTGERWELAVTNCDRKVIFKLSMTCEQGEVGVAAHLACPSHVHPEDGIR